MRENAFSSIVSSGPISGGATIDTKLERRSSQSTKTWPSSSRTSESSIHTTLTLSSGRIKGNSSPVRQKCPSKRLTNFDESDSSHKSYVYSLPLGNSDMCGSFHFCYLSFYSETAFCLYFGGSGELGQKRLLRKTRPTTAKNGSFGPHNHLLNQDKWRRMAEGRAPSHGGQGGRPQ